MSIRDYRDHDSDLDDFPYRRPAVASWIAAVAVAFAFFALGGFIKTYRQLESLREESRREIDELRQNIKRLQTSQTTQPVSRAPRRNLETLPDVANLPRTRTMPERARRSTLRPESAPVDLSRFTAAQDEANARSRLNMEIGNKSNADPLAARQLQVISVSAPNRMVMVEGGRDVGRSERARLALYRAGTWIADLRVTEVFDNMASCEIVHSNTPPEPGDSVRSTSQ